MKVVGQRGVRALCTGGGGDAPRAAAPKKRSGLFRVAIKASALFMPMDILYDRHEQSKERAAGIAATLERGITPAPPFLSVTVPRRDDVSRLADVFRVEHRHRGHHAPRYHVVTGHDGSGMSD